MSEAAAAVDVLIPVFNAAGTVRSAIESIQRQTVRNIRIIVIDDGSTDGTGAVLAELSGADPRILVLDKPNGGIVDALNFGLLRCTAQYIARHDGDDLAYPDRFATQMAYLDANPGCVAVGGAVRLVDEAGNPMGDVVSPAPPGDADPAAAPMREPYIIHPFLMARLDSLQAVGGYRYVFHAEDTDLYWRLQEIGQLHNLPDILGDYRMHSASITSSSLRNGRVAALQSQLAGLSAMRRRGGLPDLEFPKGNLDRYNAASGLAELARLGSDQLRPTEAAHLELTLAAKLLELTGYRPFEMEREDCRFVRRQLQRHLRALTPGNAAMLRRMCNGAAVRLILHGHAGRAWALVWPSLYLGVLVRLAFRVMTPDGLRRRILRSAGRATFFK